MASTTERQDALAGVHKYKLKPPTYHGDYGTLEERKYKFQAYMGFAKQSRWEIDETIRESSNKNHRHRLRDGRADPRGSNAMEAALAGDGVHPGKHYIRRSSNGMQTTSA